MRSQMLGDRSEGNASVSEEVDIMVNINPYLLIVWLG